MARQFECKGPRTLSGAWLGILGAALMLTGCAGAQVVMQSSYPLPLVQPIPAHAGLLTDNEFKNYTHAESIDGYGDWSVSFGQDQQRMFEQTLRGVFSRSSTIGGMGEAAMDASIVVRPTVVRSEISIPEQTQTEFFEMRIVYRIELLDPQGRELLNWTISAYGRADTRNHRTLGGAESGSALAAATRTALRDASALISRQLPQHAGVQAWLQEQAEANSA